MTLPGQVLHLKMENGASVSDWLGTARTHAQVAIGNLDEIRADNVSDIDIALGAAEIALQDALDEVFAVRYFVANRNEELRKMFEAETAATQRIVADMERDGLL